MAGIDIKISQLGAASGVTATDLFPMIDGSGTSTTKAAAALLKLFTTGDITALTTSDKSSVVAAINELVTLLSKETLFFPSVAIAATNGTLATITDSKITSDHILVGFVASNNSAITSSNITCNTSTGSATISGTCISATTADIILLKKSN